MPTWTIIEYPNLWKNIQAHKKTKFLNAPKISFDFTVEFTGKVYKEIKSDPLLLEKLRKPCKALFDKMIAEMSNSAQTYDKLVAEKRQAITEKGHSKDVRALKALPDGLEKLLNAVAKTYAVKMDTAVKKAWAEYIKLKADSKNFKMKVRVDFALRGFGLAVNAVKVAAAGPVGIVFAAQGTLKDVTVTLNELYLLFRKMEIIQERIDIGVKDLSDKMADGKGKKAEVLKTFVASISGYCGKTGKQMQKELGFYAGRMVEYEKKAHVLSKRLNKLLDKAEKLAERLPEEVAEDVSKIETQISKLIAMVKDRVATLPRYKTFHEDRKKKLDDLMKDSGLKNLDKWINVFETAVDAAKITTGAVTTDAAGWKNFKETLTKTSGYLATLGKNVERHFKGVSKTVSKVVA